MKGKILGFMASEGTGAISAENGERFTFAAAQWRSDRPIGPGIDVDFAPSDGAATEIYPIAASGFTAPDVAALAGSPGVQRLKALTLGTLAFPLAILLLLATFLPALSTPGGASSLWGLGKVSQMVSANPLLARDDASSAMKRIAEIDKEMAELRQPRSDPSGLGALWFSPADQANQLKQLEEQRKGMQDAAAEARWAGMVNNLLMVRYLVPILAVLLIWLAWADKPWSKAALATGAVSIFVVVLIFMFRNALVGDPDEESLGGMMSKQMDAALSVGFGAYLIGLCGIGLILAGLGIIRNPLAQQAMPASLGDEREKA